MREMIEKVSYPPFIELFARERFEGWDAWGGMKYELEKRTQQILRYVFLQFRLHKQVLLQMQEK